MWVEPCRKHLKRRLRSVLYINRIQGRRMMVDEALGTAKTEAAALALFDIGEKDIKETGRTGRSESKTVVRDSINIGAMRGKLR